MDPRTVPKRYTGLLPILFLFLLQGLGAETLQRIDGTDITYYLSRPDEASYPLAVILQGSECLRVSDKYQDYIEALRSEGIAVLRVEKPGLHAGVEIGDCTDEYLRLNTPERRVLDLVMVIAELRKDQAWNGGLALVGGSEGAMVAAMTAPLLPEVEAVVLLSGGGGLSFAEEVLEGAGRQMLESGMPEAEVDQRLVEMREFMRDVGDDPSPYKEWMSDGKLVRNTHLWWAHAVDLRLTTALERVQAPVLLVHGRSDTGTPVRSAELLIEELTAKGKLNIELRLYDGGHAPPREKVTEALRWVGSQLE